MPQHDDAMRHLRHQSQVVRDIDGGHPAALDEHLDCPQHLDLRRHIESGCRLVEDDEIGIGHQRHGDHRPLQLSAGYLVRKPVTEGVRIGELQLGVKIERLCSRLRARHQAMHDAALHRLIEKPERGIE